MSIDISGKVAVISGASRGIGRASAIALAKEGVNIVATARTQEELDSLVAECEALGVQALGVAGDAANPDDVANVKAKALEKFGQVDILVNNAGVAKYGTLLEHTLEDYDWMMTTNMRSTFLFTHTFLPEMLDRGNGNVITVSSQAGYRGFPTETVYCSTKFAQVGFMQALDQEVREKGIKCSVIAPGGVHTTFAFGTGREPGQSNLEGMLDAEDVADAVVFAAKQSPKSRILVVGMRPMNESF